MDVASPYWAPRFLFQRGLGFIYFIAFLIAINQFQDTRQHGPEQVREALKVPAAVEVVTCDARSPESTKQTLIAAAEHALAEHHAPRSRKA